MREIVTALLQPHVVLYLLMVYALVRLWRRPEASRRLLLCLTVPFVLLSVACLPVVAYLALGSLEWNYPPLAKLPADAQAIVVLSGYVNPEVGEGVEAELGEGTLYRCLKAHELHRQRPGVPIIASGGRPPGQDGGPTFASVMRSFLLRLGADPAAVLAEERSSTTYENAVETAKLLKERGWTRVVLVTDAAHLTRSEGCFRKQGVDVIPCGCRYRATDFSGSPLEFLPDATAAANLHAAAHEWLGIAWYWTRGRL